MAVRSVPGDVWGDVVVLFVEDDEAGDRDAGDARVCKYIVESWGKVDVQISNDENG